MQPTKALTIVALLAISAISAPVQGSASIHSDAYKRRVPGGDGYVVIGPIESNSYEGSEPAIVRRQGESHPPHKPGCGAACEGGGPPS